MEWKRGETCISARLTRIHFDCADADSLKGPEVYSDEVARATRPRLVFAIDVSKWRGAPLSRATKLVDQIPWQSCSADFPMAIAHLTVQKWLLPLGYPLGGFDESERVWGLLQGVVVVHETMG